MADDTKGTVASPADGLRGSGSPAPATAPTEDGSPSPDETPDYEAMYKAAVAERDTAQNHAKAWEGRARNVATSDDIAELAGRLTVLSRRIPELTDPDLDYTARQKLAAEIESEDEASQATSEARGVMREIRGEIAGLLSESGLAESDERFTEAFAIWDDALATLNSAKGQRAFRLVSRVVFDYERKQAKDATEAAGRSQRIEDLDQDAGGRGAGTGKTQFTAAEIGRMTPNEYEAARKHIIK